jgi:3-hydroxybutyryl-CoA dehydrogenase
MKKIVIGSNSILVKGEGKLAFSVTACLLIGGYSVTLYISDVQKAFNCLNIHKHDIESVSSGTLNLDNLNIVDQFTASDYYLAIAITSENIAEKQLVIKELEQKLSNKTLIAINTESIALSDIQVNAQHLDRIIGANWVEPAHTTLFLEVLYNGPVIKSMQRNFVILQD